VRVWWAIAVCACSGDARRPVPPVNPVPGDAAVAGEPIDAIDAGQDEQLAAIGHARPSVSMSKASSSRRSTSPTRAPPR